MIGLVVEIILSWLLLKYLQNRNLQALGLLPKKAHLKQFLIGFFLASICYYVYTVSATELSNSSWELNPDFSLKDFFASSYWTLKSVLFEEFIFRGALLYVLIKKVGPMKAIILSAIGFGIYHWFSYGAFGDPISMTYVFIWTGSWGLMFAYAFAKTGSMYLPIALHLGWNLCHIVAFSQGPLGDQLFVVSEKGSPIEGWPSLAVTLLQLFLLPLLVCVGLNKFPWNIQKERT